MRADSASRALIVVLGAFFLLNAPRANSQVGGSGTAKVSDDDYAVYNALLDEVNLPKQNDVLIVDDTLDFQCGADSHLSILLNGCSPMVLPPNTPEAINELLVRNWPKMEKETWDDFRFVNSKSVKLRDAFTTTCKHELIGDDVHTDNLRKSDSPSGAFYFSRVGFNAQKTQAIVFVFYASYGEHVGSTGDYFIFQLSKGKRWKLSGRVNEIESDGNNK